MNIAMIGQKGLPGEASAKSGLPAIIGGVERHVHELSARLVKYGHSVTVYSRAWYAAKTKTEIIEGVTVKPVPTIKTKHLDTITHTLFSTIDAMRKNAQIIHYHGVGPALWSWLPRLLRPNATVVTTFHCIDRKHAKWGFIARRLLKLGEWASCRFARHTIVVSNTLAQYVRDVYDTDAIYIPNGANVNHGAPNPDWLSQFKLAPQTYVLAVSRFIPHKGLAELIAAWNTLSAQSSEAMKEKKLVIVGDGHYTDTYVQILRNLAKLNPNIIFTGHQHGENLNTLYAHAHSFVHPSRSEGLPLAVLEAMSFGLPVLLSHIPEHKELGIDQRWLFATGNQESLTDGLKQLLLIDESARLQIKNKYQSIIEQKYNWDKIAAQTSELYCNAVKRQSLQSHLCHHDSRPQCAIQSSPKRP